MTTTIPALPVLVPLSLVAFALLAWRLQRRDELTAPRLGVAAVWCVYGAGVLNEVLLPFRVELGAARDHLPPWRVYVHLTPLTTGLDDPIGIALNVALFVPFGVLLPLVMRVPTAARVVAAGFVVSLGIEIVQLLADVTVSSGRVADVDDLLGNTVGALVGYLLFQVALRLPGAPRVAAALRARDRLGV